MSGKVAKGWAFLTEDLNATRDNAGLGLWINIETKGGTEYTHLIPWSELSEDLREIWTKDAAHHHAAKLEELARNIRTDWDIEDQAKGSVGARDLETLVVAYHLEFAKRCPDAQAIVEMVMRLKDKYLTDEMIARRQDAAEQWLGQGAR